jgi:Flp pilus assembly protein TadG
MSRHRCRGRRGALTLEAAFVYPVMFLLLLGILVGGQGVLRFQQVACQAREAARWASVRGSNYQKTTGNASPTQQQVRDGAVMPLAAGMDPQALSVQVQWVDLVGGQVVDWDSASKAPSGATANGTAVTNHVRVTVSYQWSPGVLIGPLTLSSTAEIPMNN